MKTLFSSWKAMYEVCFCKLLTISTNNIMTSVHRYILKTTRQVCGAADPLFSSSIKHDYLV